MISVCLQALLEFLPFVSYLSSGAAFKRPLTSEKEREYIARSLNGDQVAKHALIEHNMRLIAHIAKKYMTGGRDMDDLISIGTIGLIKAVNTYNPENGKTLGTYAARCIENEILMSVRTEKKRRGEIPMQEAIGTDKQGNEVLLGEILGTPKDDVEKTAEQSIEVEKLYRAIETKLTERERLIVSLRYGLYNGTCFTQREIAERMDISRSYVSRIEKKALSKLLQAIR